MFDDFFKLLENIHPLSKEAKDLILPLLSIQKLEKNQFILKNGDICNHFYFFNKGFGRIFYYKNGKDITEWFAPEKTLCFSITSYFEDTPSKLVIECLENSEVVYLSKKGLNDLKLKNIEIANLLLDMYAESLKLSQKRTDAIQFETAKQRYENLITYQPQIVKKAALQHIASYLGITAETLSRIRTQL